MPLAFFLLPLTFNFSFLYGFLNFSYSIAAFLVVAGLLMRWEGRLSWSRALALASILVLVFFTHLVGYLEAALLAACILGAACMLGDRRLVASARAAIALVPGAVLTLAFITLTQSGQVSTLGDPVSRLEVLLSLTWGVAAYDRLERLPCVATAVALWVLVLIAAVRSRWSWIRCPVPVGLAVFVVLSSVVALFAPGESQSGGSYASQRLVLFPVLGAVLWLAYTPLPRRALFVGATVAGLSALALATVRYDELRAIETALQDLRALESCFTPGSTVIQANLTQGRFGSLGRLDPLSAEVGRLAAVRDGFDLGNVDWKVPFGLLRFRKETNPFAYLVRPGARVEDAPPPLDIEGFERRTGILVDYVVLFGRSVPAGSVQKQPKEKSPDLVAFELGKFESVLTERYALVKVSPLGLWELNRPGFSGELRV